MYHYERAIIMTIKFALLLSVSAGGLIVLLSKTADADLKSPLFEDIIPLSGSRYANVCFITDSEDCRGNEFETFENLPIEFTEQDKEFLADPSIDKEILERALSERSGRVVWLNPPQFY